MPNVEKEQTELNVTPSLLSLLEAVTQIATEIRMYAPSVRGEALYYHPNEMDELMDLTDSIHCFGGFLEQIIEGNDIELVKHQIESRIKWLTSYIDIDVPSAFSYPSIETRLKNIGKEEVCIYKPILIERNIPFEQGKIRTFFSYLFGVNNAIVTHCAIPGKSTRNYNRLHLSKSLIEALQGLISEIDDSNSWLKGSTANLNSEIARILRCLTNIAVEMRMYSSYARTGNSYFAPNDLDELIDLCDAILLFEQLVQVMRTNNKVKILEVVKNLEIKLKAYLNPNMTNAFKLPPMVYRGSHERLGYSPSNQEKNSEHNRNQIYYEVHENFKDLPKFLQRVLAKSKIGKVRRGWQRELAATNKSIRSESTYNRTPMIKELVKIIHDVKHKVTIQYQ